MGLRVVLGAALAACGLVFLGPATASAPSGPTSAVKALGVIKKTSPPNGARPAVRAATAPNAKAGTAPSNFDAAIDPNQLLTYHGGPVMHAQNVYVIYWQPSGFNFGADATASTTYENDVNQWVQDVAADSGKTSNAFGAISQYRDSSGPGQYAVTFGGSYVDTTVFPNSNNCGETAPCLTDQQLINEIDSVVNNHLHVAGGLTAQFALVLPEGVTTCTDTDSGVCSDNFFCAYHSAYDHHPANTTPFIYLNLPYEPDFACHSNLSPDLNPSGGLQPEPNAPSNADTTIDDMSHEMREATDDPLGTAWFDASGNESDDKCIYAYGSLLGPSNDFNQLVNGHHYDTQLEWSNAKRGCYQMGVPTVSLDSTSAIDGGTVGITGTNFLTTSPAKPVVTFNKIAVPSGSITVDSTTHLTVTVPDGNTTGKVTVQAIGGTGTSTQTFGLKPTISPLADGHDVTGTKIEVDGTGFFGVKSVKFGTVAGVFSSVAADGTSLKVVVPAAAVTGNLTVQTAGGTSDPVTFIVTPHITSFTPLKAPGLSNVTINGTGLGGATVVDFFNGHASPQIVSDTATKIVAQVPNDAAAGPISVSNADDSDIASAASFTPMPAISSFSPLDGAVTTPVTITGAIFTGATMVKFGAVNQPLFTVDNPHQITTTVPALFTTSGKITVVGPAGTAISTQTFSITMVTAVTPLSAAAGATVTITGQGLASTTTVDFNNHTGVTPSVPPTATSVKVVVPPDAEDGALHITTSNGVVGLPTPKPFKPLPRITSFDKSRYEAGCTVTVTGTNLFVSGPAATGKLGSVPITPTSVTPTSFTFVIPDVAVTGTVSFTDAAGTTVSTGKVNVVPTISGDPAPNDGVAADHIVLTGKTFTGTTSVKFGADTHGAPFVVSNAGQTLTVTVPTTAVSGKITVTNAGGATQTDHDFVVHPVIKSFTPTGASVGATLTVTGTGLADAAGARFDGSITTTQVSNPTPTSLNVVVPPGVTGTPQGIEVLSASGGWSAVSTTQFAASFSVTDFSPATAPTSAQITLNGVGLSGVTEVDFNGHAGTGFAINGAGTQITVHVPSGTDTAGLVTVKKGSTTIQAPGTFTLLSIASLSDSAGVPGSVVTVTGTGFGAVTGVSFNGTAALVLNVSDPTDLTVTVPSGATTGTLSLTVPGATLDGPSFTVESDLSGLVINEVRTDASGFVELYNGTGGGVDLNGVRLVFRPAAAVDASTDVMLTAFGAGTLLGTGDFLSVDTSALNVTGGGVALELPDGTIVDSVGWGTATNAFVVVAAAVAPASGHSIGRHPDGTNTNDNSTDFVEETTPTPGATNP
jgi:hypothetical protein